MPSQAVLELMVTLKDQASSGLASLGGAVGKLGLVTGGVALAGVAALGAAVVSGIGDAREAAKIYAQTENVIKSTGGAAGVTAAQVSDLAASLSAASGQSLFGDDDIQQSTNLLLTFTNIKQSALEAATAISVDMAQALGGAPKDAAIQLGKALNDPIAGISALSRVGVSFTDQQKEQIKTMQEAGDMAGAQAVILAELNKEFGGSAAAAAAADGGWAQINDRMGEAAETVGAALLPVLGMLSGFLVDTIVPAVEAGALAFGDLVNYFTAVAEDGDTLNDFLSNLPAGIQPIAQAVADVVVAFQAWLNDPSTQAGIQQISDALTNGIGAAFAFLTDTAIPALTTYWTSTLLPIFNALVDLWTASLQPALSELADWLAEVIPPAIQTLADFWTGTLQPAIAVVAQFIAEQLIPKIGELVNWLRDNLPPAIQALAAFWIGTLQPALAVVWAFLQDNVIPIIQRLTGDVFGGLNTKTAEVSSFWTGTLQPALKAVWDFLDTYIIPILTALGSVAIALVKKEIELLSALWTGVLEPALRAVWEFIDTYIVPIFEDLANTYIADLKKAINDLSPVLDAITTSFGYIGDAVEVVIDFLGELADAIDAIEIPSWLKGASPPPLADWFAFIGIEISNLSAALPEFAAELERIGQLAQRALGSVFGADASIDRQVAANLDKLKNVLPQYMQYTQGALAAAQAEAEKMLDPAQGARYFKMRSDQILEYAKLQKDLSEAATEQDRERIAAQMLLINQAQTAEIAAFQALQNAATAPMAAIAAQIKALMDSMPGTDQTDAQIALLGPLQALYDQLINAGRRAIGGPVSAGQPYWVGERGPELFMPQTSGAIVPNGGAAGMTFNNTFVLPPGTPAQLVDMVIEKLNRQMGGRR